MFHRVIFWVEVCFFATFWLQTRINLREWWPNWFSPPLNSDYLIPFVYLSDILLVLLLGFWLCPKVASNQLFSTRKIIRFLDRPSPSNWANDPKLWLIIFLLVALTSVVINGGAWWSWYGWLRLLEGVGLSFYIYHRWQQSRFQSYAILLLLLGLVLESVILVGEWLMQGSLGLQWLGEWSFSVYTPGIAKVLFDGQEYLRAYGTFSHPNVAAGALMLGVIVLSWRILTNLRVNGSGKVLMLAQESELKLPDRIGSALHWINGNQGYILAITLGVLLMGLFVTFSRSVWLVSVSCLGLLLVWSGQNLRQFMKLRTAVVWLVVGGMLLISVFGPMVWSRFSSLDGTDRLSIERRVQLNDVAIELINQRPWLGTGVNDFITHLANFGPLYGIGIWREPVHNLYLLIAVETGLVGAAVWLIAHGVVWMRLGSATKRDGTRNNLILLMTLWLAVVVLGLIDHYWWTSQQGRLIWWLLVGGSMAIIRARTRPTIEDTI